jgi:hypothetical protein
MTTMYQQTTAFGEVLARLESAPVTVEIPWIDADDPRPIVLQRREGDRIVFFDPGADDSEAPAPGQPFDDLGPPRQAEADGLASMALAELEARFELGGGVGFLG